MGAKPTPLNRANAMHMFAAERPNANQGRKALADGSAMPYPVVVPTEEGKFALCFYLRVETSHSYGYFRTELDASDLPAFFTCYADDPELTLLRHFGWTTPALRATPRTIPPTNPLRHPTHDPMEDLL
jgi:hypothetical protein